MPKATNRLSHAFRTIFTEMPGRPSQNVLRVAANIAEDETVTIGADVYDIEVVNTDSTDTSGALFTNTTDPLTVDITALTALVALTPAKGDLWRLENEIVRITKVVGNLITVERGVSGTTTASHGDVAVYVGDGINAASTIAVGVVATLTPTVFTAALVDDINNNGTEFVVAVLISVNEILVQTAVIPGGDPEASAAETATTEDMGGTDNAWDGATMTAGERPERGQMQAFEHVVSTQEAALVSLHILFPFTIGGFIFTVKTTAGVDKVITDLITSTANRVDLVTTGGTHIAATDVVTVVAWK